MSESKNRYGYLSNYLSSGSARMHENRFLSSFAANYEIDLCLDLKSKGKVIQLIIYLGDMLESVEMVFFLALQSERVGY